jgi:8-amino-7-oxononanoate synthase
VSFGQSVRDELAALESAGLLRKLAVVTSEQGPTIVRDGHRVLSMSSNDYLGLASHSRLRAAVAEGAKRFGVGAGASRLISGTMEAHVRAEEALAEFCESESALLFGSGYAANLGVLQGLFGEDDLIVSDALNHASIIDGCRLSRAQVRVFPHRNVDAAQQILEENRPRARRALIATDAVFSMDGDRAPVRSLRLLADEFDCALMVDEAHSLGVLGPSGRGLCAEQGIVPEILVGTLGKAFGLAGAFVAATKPTVDLLVNRARSLVFSTAPPAPIAHATVDAVDLVRSAVERRLHLLDIADELRDGLRALQLEVPDGDTPIIPVLVGDVERTMALSSALLDHGVFVRGVRPPTVPAGTSRLRVVPVATHTIDEVRRCIAAFEAVIAAP